MTDMTLLTYIDDVDLECGAHKIFYLGLGGGLITGLVRM
jgi:hypothetical protein